MGEGGVLFEAAVCVLGEPGKSQQKENPEAKDSLAGLVWGSDSPHLVQGHVGMFQDGR